MRYYTVEMDGTRKVAVSTDGIALYELAEFSSMAQLIGSGGRPEIPVGAKPLAQGSYRVLAPIPEPAQDVLCLGINYADHATEAARFSADAFGGERPVPIFFSKRVSYAPGPDDVIPSYPGLVDSLDYEVELAVVIGRDAFRVSADEAKDYVFGYTVLNDVSARNLQTAHKQWHFGKSLDGFCPMGPCIVTADEFSFPPRQAIRCRVNGELRQDSTTANLINGIPAIIETLSAGMTLRAGTIIATGTPSGVGMGMRPPVFLQPGDVVECEIEGIGILRNTVGS